MFSIIYLIVLCLLCVILRHFEIEGTYYTSSFAFPTGILFSFIEKRFKFWHARYWKIICLVLLLLVSIGCFYYPILTVPSIPIWSLAVIIVISCCRIPQCRIINFLSNISYELYICQGIVFVVLNKIHIESRILFLVLLFSIDVVIAYLSKQISMKTYRQQK